MIELACGEHGEDRIQRMVLEMGNGESTDWFADKRKILKLEQLRKKHPLKKIIEQNEELTATSQLHQLQVLIKRGIIKAKRDATLTHLRIGVNIIIAAMLGFLFIDAGNEGSRVLDNYNLLFSILMHHMMATMMLTVLTCKCKQPDQYRADAARHRVCLDRTNPLINPSLSIADPQSPPRWVSS